MTTGSERHPFLDDLAEDVVLVSSVLRAPVSGRETVLAVAKAGAALYRSQTPTFLGKAADDRTYFEYEVELAGGETGSGLVSIRRGPSGEVVHLHIAFSPLGAVLAVAEGVKKTLAGRFGPELLL